MEPNLINVEESQSAELKATSAVICVKIRGQSLFTGTEAFTKAAEVRNLLVEVQKFEITNDDVTLVAVSAKSTSGLMTTSSSAEYILEIRCLSLESLAPVLSAICSQKNAEVVAICWQYEDYETAKRELLEECTLLAKSRAEHLSRLLGAKLRAVHRLKYVFRHVPNRSSLTSEFEMLSSLDSAASTRGLADLNLSNVCSLSVTVKADFSVADFADAQSS
ncbi:MAG: SIMPL domain-containing protein [Planctomycetaceae bacterium]